MKKEEAIKRLKEYAQYSYGIWRDNEEDTKAFDMAIEALSADTVSREQYDYVCEEYNKLVHKAVCIKLCDENCEYEKGKTCYHARGHSAIEALSAETPTIQGKHQLSEVDTSTIQGKHQLSDLISRADAIEAVASRDETDGTVKVFTGRQVNEILSALPSADVVEVVRCKDCIHYRKDEVCGERAWETCKLSKIVTYDTGFCCWAERREE